jgi:hypothetical protein
MDQNQNDIDYDALIRGEASNKPAEYRLWVAVVLSAVLELLREPHGHDAGPARSFLFGENPLFDMVAEGMGYEPGGLREKIRAALKRGKASVQSLEY